MLSRSAQVTKLSVHESTSSKLQGLLVQKHQTRPHEMQLQTTNNCPSSCIHLKKHICHLKKQQAQGWCRGKGCSNLTFNQQPDPTQPMTPPCYSDHTEPQNHVGLVFGTSSKPQVDSQGAAGIVSGSEGHHPSNLPGTPLIQQPASATASHTVAVICCMVHLLG